MTLPNFDLSTYDKYLARGLRNGQGDPEAQVCIEQALSLALGEDLSDHPTCVADAVREYGIAINDTEWSSSKARADGLRDFGLAQLGSKGVIGDAEFARLLAERTIRVLLPNLLREVSSDPAILTAADRCETEGTAEAAHAARNAAAHAARAAGHYAATATAATAATAASYAADAASYATYAASYAANAASYAANAASYAASVAASYAANAAASYAANAAADASSVVSSPDRYLRLSAEIAVGVLRDLGSPGVAWVDGCLG